MKKSKKYFDWLQFILFSILIFITIPYAPKIWKSLSPDQKSLAISGIYLSVFLFGIFIFCYMFFYRKDIGFMPFVWLFVIGVLYFNALNTLKDFPIEKLHLIEYGILTLLVFNALKNDVKDLSIYIWSLLIVFCIGILDETIQWVVPNRVGTIEDVWLNAKSGILALSLIGLVIRPQGIEKKFHLSNLKKIYIPISLVLVIAGVFINFIHDFGYRIKASNFIEIYSHFPEEELRLINDILRRDMSLLKTTAQRAEGLNSPGSDISDRESKELTFFKEAGGHRWERDNAFLKKRFSKSLKEHIILKNYYSSVLYFNSFKWGKNKESLVESFAKKEKGESLYISPVSGILITKFSKLQMWTFIGIAVIFLTLLFIRG